MFKLLVVNFTIAFGRIGIIGPFSLRHGVVAWLSRPNNYQQVIWLKFLLRGRLHESGNHSTVSPVWPARKLQPAAP